MKSKKAKEYINCIVPNKGNLDYCAQVGRLNGSIYMDVCKAVELAEQEAEERMQRKAIEAFKELCFHRDEDRCSISYGLDDNGNYDAGKKCDEYCGHCGILKNFIEKMKEE